jgi:hypothetical protein
MFHKDHINKRVSHIVTRQNGTDVIPLIVYLWEIHAFQIPRSHASKQTIITGLGNGYLNTMVFISTMRRFITQVKYIFDSSATRQLRPLLHMEMCDTHVCTCKYACPHQGTMHVLQRIVGLDICRLTAEISIRKSFSYQASVTQCCLVVSLRLIITRG